MVTSVELSGAVLIGGRSRRMGVPKALLRLTEGGPTMVELAAKVLRAVADDIMLVGTPDWPIPASLKGVRRIRDAGDGAIDGVIAALGAARYDHCLVVGCDMPFLDAALLREMAERAIESGAGVIACDGGGMHPLHAIWHRADLPHITAMAARGERSLTGIVGALNMTTIDLSGRESTARWSVFNANTPADLEMAKSHVNA